MKTVVMIAGLALFSHTAHAEIANIDAAANSMDINKLKQLVVTEHDYSQAYANYRLAISANVLGQPQVAKTALAQAQATLELLNSSQANGENYTLLASIYGMKIALEPMSAQSFGIEYAKALANAEQLDPQNPRLKLVQAMGAYNTPAAYGGSPQQALELANQAITLFQAPCDTICWGEAEAYTWRGLAQQALGNDTAAIADWQQALAVQSDYSWAQFLIRKNTPNDQSQ